jgi:prepilin-type N-terminal cleavage/methylation domain-containing protein
MRCNRTYRQAGSSLRHQSKGFTIIELLVATSVFSVILIVITTGIIRITQTYDKGINLVNTQNTARSIMDSIAQGIQFSGGMVSWPDTASAGGVGCIGNQEYDFQLGPKLESGGTPDGTGDWQSSYALALNPNASNCTISAVPVSAPAASSSELLSPHMRLTKLGISRVSAADSMDNLYAVSVTVVYGDYDLLCNRTYSPASDGGCSPDSPAIKPTDSNFHSFLTSPDLTCRSGAGSEYCAVSALSTVVQQRLTIDK